MPPKRRREGSGSGGGGGGGGGPGSPPPSPALKKRCRSFDLEIRGCRHLQELITSVARVHKLEGALESAISRMEHVSKAFTSILNRVPSLCRTLVYQSPAPSYMLRFVNSLSNEVFTKKDIHDANGDPIKIAIMLNNQQGDSSDRIFSAKIKVVVLHGDFNGDNQVGWTLDEFNSHIVRPRDKVGAVLTGKLELNLKDGEAFLQNATFIDNSKFTRSGKFRLGVMITDDIGYRVQEGITEPFTVKDRRGEGCKKHAIPFLADELWRLKKISKTGVFYKALTGSGIHSVKHFLIQYYKDEQVLRHILAKAPDLVWTTIVDHAKKCDPGGEVYSYFKEDKNVTLFFSSVYQPVGATLDGHYTAFGDLDKSMQAQVEQWSKVAYEHMAFDQPDYEMDNGQPRLIDRGNFQGSSTLRCNFTELLQGHIGQNKINFQDADQSGTSVSNGISSGNEFSCSNPQHCTLGRVGSVRVRQFNSVHEDNADTSLDISVHLEPGSETQYPTTANDITGSVTLHCPSTTSNEITGSIALDQAALDVSMEHEAYEINGTRSMEHEAYEISGTRSMEHEAYEMPSANNDTSVSQWLQEQPLPAQYDAPPCSLNGVADLCAFSRYSSFQLSNFHEMREHWEQNQMSEDWLGENIDKFSSSNVDKLPADVCCNVAKLLSYRKWIKLTALVKWLLVLRASKTKEHV